MDYPHKRRADRRRRAKARDERATFTYYMSGKVYVTFAMRVGGEKARALGPISSRGQVHSLLLVIRLHSGRSGRK